MARSRPTPAAAAALSLALCAGAQAAETSVSGRITFGVIHRVQAADPDLLTTVNAAALGLEGYGSGGNADDANSNYRRGDAASRAVKAYLDLSWRAGDSSAFARLKAWHDAGLERDGRPWGNVANGYVAGAPLSDRGAPRLSRFSGVALGEAWIEHRTRLGAAPASARLGLQSLRWGEGWSTPGGLEALNPKDLPALHRAGAAPQELRVPLPMLSGRIEFGPSAAVEAYYQSGFRPTAADMCGTLWSMNDYMTDGCDKVMAGLPALSDRARLPLGAYMKRLPVALPDGGESGLALRWKSAPLATEFGLYHARYASRTPMPNLRRSTRVGQPALVPGDPDGRNMAYFIDYPEDLAITALSFTHRRGRSSVHGEVSYRPRVPFMLAPGDVVPPFLNPSVPSLLRASVDATAPGAVFRGYDLYPVSQAQLGLGHAWQLAGLALSGSAELVGKRAHGLPDQALRRYGRADIFGVGPVHGVCNATTGNRERQCSLRGYATANAWGYRLRLDLRLPPLLPGLSTAASAVFSHDVKGWSGDFLLNEGRKTANLALRFDYRQRYVAELGYLPNWGGDYNPASDRDTASLAVGVRF